MGAKLIHLINESWLKCEIKRIIDGKINWLCLACTDNEVEEVRNLFFKVCKPYQSNDCTHTEANEIIMDMLENRNKRGLITLVTEEWFKENGYLPRVGYDSFLVSHDVKDVFFKSELSRNCK